MNRSYLNINACIKFLADAQLAFLIREGIADIVISEDSDLTLFGCQKILFKMDKQGNGKNRLTYSMLCVIYISRSI